MRNYVCSFASSNFSYTIDRLKKQVLEFDFFDGSFFYDENEIGEHFEKVLNDGIKENVRGYGYWSWKPYIIKLSLNRINDGDSLIYLDAGCHLNKKGLKRLLKYYSILEKSKSGILVFQKKKDGIHYKIIGKTVIKDRFIEANWNKGDLLDYFGLRNDTVFLNSAQIIANAIIIKKTPQSCLFIDEWLRFFYDELHLVDDSPSVSENMPSFIESRFDQSALSILSKQHQVTVLSTDEVEGLPSLVINSPILAVRDINGRMKYGNLNFFRITRILKTPFYSLFFWFKMKKIQILKL